MDNDYIQYKMRGEIIIPKLQRLQLWSVGMDKWFYPTFNRACGYLSMLG